MAFKFQLGQARMSGSLIQEGDFALWDDDGTVRVSMARDNGSITGSAMSLSDGDLTNVGAIKCDVIEPDAAATGLSLVFGGNTTKNMISLTDNLADALNFEEAGASYLKFTTTNGSELITFGKNSTFASTTIANLGTVTTADIDGGTIDGCTIATSDVTVGTGKTLTVSAGTLTTSAAQNLAIVEGCASNIDVGAYDLRAQTVTADSLTSGRVPFASTNGLLIDDSDFTFATDTLTVTKIGAFEAAGAIDFSDEAMTNVNIDSGAIDGTTIGAASQSTIKATTISGSGQMDIVGAANLNGNLEVKGTVINFPNVGAASLDTGDLMLSLDATSKDLQARTRANVITDFAGVMAGTVTATGLADASGVLSIDIANLDAEVIATGDKLIFSDAGDDGLHSETVDDLFTKGPGLATAGTIAVADDHFVFLDGGATGDAKTESIVDLVAAMAGSGLTASGGQLSTSAAAGANDVGNASAVLQEGFNFSSVVFNAARTWTLPKDGVEAGDVVTVKAPSNADTYPLTIAGSGSYLIDGEDSLVLDSPYGAVALVAGSGSTTGIDWYIK